MARLIVLLRGVNLGPRNRVAMPELRRILADAGFEDVKTYVQSGNVVVSSSASPKRVARDVERLVADHFGLDIKVVVRTRAELARIVKRNPLGKVAKNPKRYQVTFLDSKPDPELVKKIEATAVSSEKLAHSDRELYTWHPDGFGRSKLAALLARSDLGVTGTARNWATVTKLLAIADE